MSNEKSPGCLGYIGDEILPNYVGINYIINKSKDPGSLLNNQYFIEKQAIFFVAHV